MKTIVPALLLFLGLTLFSCQQNKGVTVVSGTDTLNLTPLAETITYDVVLKNPNPDDTWVTECLKGLDLQGFVNQIFDLIYTGKVKALDYYSSQPLAIEDVKMLEKDFPRSTIGKVQFMEGWYFDKDAVKMVKKVKSIMIAYELYDLDGRVNGYKAGFVVPLLP
jgi:hypothetical protein